MNNIQIRACEITDLDRVADIEHNAHLSPWSRKLFENSFTNKHHNYVLESGEQVVGYYFAHFVADELTLENICINQPMQRQGYANQLMRHLVTLASTLKATDIWLEVRASNASAIHLYEKFGFEQQGIRKNYYPIPQRNTKEDAVLMRHSLV